MTQARMDGRTSPYLLEDKPTSKGRLFMARAFEHWCMLHWGHSGDEIAAAFDGAASPETSARVRMAARLIGEALARDVVRAWARPFGGGDPVELKPGVWEIDDFDGRFATCAIDPKRPFEPGAATSWLFVEMDGWNALVEASLAEPVRPPRTRTFRLGPGAPVEVGADPVEPARAVSSFDDDRLVRLPEVKRQTGLSRSTIYRRMAEERFPQTVPMEGNIAAWREREVAEWLASPR